jgi:uncharacterized surface anchored protein
VTQPNLIDEKVHMNYKFLRLTLARPLPNPPPTSYLNKQKRKFQSTEQDINGNNEADI